MVAGPKDFRRLSLASLWPRLRYTRVRQDIFGRTAPRPQFVPPDDDSAGAGLSSARKHCNRRQSDQRYYHAIAATLLAAVLLFGSCKSSTKSDPQQEYRTVQLTFLQGDLGKATQQADQLYHYYSGKDREWAYQFRVLEARILAYRRLSQAALTKLDFKLPDDLANGDLAIRKRDGRGTGPSPRWSQSGSG